jgi:integrase
VQAFYTAKLAEGYAASTLRQMHIVIHQAVKTAMRHGMVARNVTELVDAPTAKREEMRVWTPEQARTCLNTVASTRLEALYRLTLSTCMREGELLGLCWRNVDLDAGTIQVKTALKTNRLERRELHNPKTYRSRRRLRSSA